MKICVIFNPVARGDKARRFRDALQTLAERCELRPTDAAGAGRRLAAEAAREGFDTVVAAGGDGTVNEVLNGLGDAAAFPAVRLGVLPLGTVNVFAKELKIPSNLRAAWLLIERGRESRRDLACAEFTADDIPVRRYFAQMAGAGWDARAIELTNWEWKKRVGPLAYVAAGLRAMSGPLPRVTVSNGRERCEGELVLLGLGAFYGGRYRVFPRADPSDGLLEATVLPRVSWLRAVRAGWGLMWNRLYTTGGAVHLRGETFELSSEGMAPFHVEGDNVGHLPARFTVQRQALRVLVP